MELQGLSILGPIIILFIFCLAMLFVVLKMEKLRKFAKPFYAFFISVVAYIIVPDYPIICLFFFLHAIGDFIFAFKHKKGVMVLAQIVLLITHSLDLIHEIDLVNINIVFIILIILLSCIAFFLCTYFKFKKKLPKLQIILGSVYFGILIATGILSIISSFKYTFLNIFVIIGISLFIIGDLYEIKWNYIKKDVYNKLYTNLTYFIGLFFVALGLILPLIKF